VIHPSRLPSGGGGEKKRESRSKGGRPGLISYAEIRSSPAEIAYPNILEEREK